MTKSKLKLNFPLIVPFFIIALIACTIIRYLQYTTVIEAHSGFFVHDGGFMNNAYYIFFVISMIGFIALSLVDKKANKGILGKKSAGLPLSTVYSIVGAGLFAYCGFLLAGDAYIAFKEKAHIIPLLALIFSALSFTFVGYVVFTYKKLRPFAAIAFLFIAANSVCIASLLFMERIYTSNLSAQLIVLSTYLLLSVFFLNSGRIIIQSETRFTATTASVCGYSLVLLTVSDSLSRIVYYFSVDASLQKTLLHEDNGFALPTPLFIAQAIAALWIIFALTVRNTNQIKTQTEQIETEENEVEEIEEVEAIPIETENTEEISEPDTDTDTTD